MPEFFANLPGLLLSIIGTPAFHLIVMLVAITWFYHARALQGQLPARRPLPALDTVRSALARGAETGRPIHISPGGGTVGYRTTTAETVVGLLAVERVAVEAARNGAPLLVSSGDAVAHLALRGSLPRTYRRAGQPQDYHSDNVQMLAHQDSTAYVTGVMTIYGRQQLEASQLVGSFGQEFLLCGEDGAQRGIPQVAGATSTAALPVMLLTTPDTLLGEEVFAAEAYLTDERIASARLRAQDALRFVVVIMIVGGFLYSLVIQPAVPGLPPLPGA